MGVRGGCLLADLVLLSAFLLNGGILTHPLVVLLNLAIYPAGPLIYRGVGRREDGQ
ncbi:MAG: hypothetical protein Kow0069_29610 [Promethearchaeota archaeon]